MVEDDVLAICNAQGVGTGVAHHSHSHAKIAADGIAGTGEREPVAIEGDTLARCRLSGDVYVFTDRNTRLETNDTSHIKYNNTVGTAHRIPERATASVVEIGNMIHLSTTSTSGKASKAFCPGECQLLCRSGS